MPGEGSLQAPIRHPIDWTDADFYDADKLDGELRRVFDICHGCRRCFNLCDSFPRLFDLIDESPSGELDTVGSADFAPVIDACTLCDMCFMTKCPYVPPHDFNLDFPHLMLRARAVEHKAGKTGIFDRELAKTDRNGRMGCSFPSITNWASNRGNRLTRGVLQAVGGVHRDAELPTYSRKTLVAQACALSVPVNQAAPGFGRKVVLYGTCFSNYNAPDIGLAALKVLVKNGVQVDVLHPGCCGMPQLEQGDIAQVAGFAETIAAAFRPWIDRGYTIIPLVPSCALMLKFEWPLIIPQNDDVRVLASATRDISEYICALAKDAGLAPGLQPLDGAVTVHVACHARAQNMGRKAVEMLRLIPDADIHVIERCSGHGGAWGVRKDHFEIAIKIGKPVARQAAKHKAAYLVSECPLARDHILQGLERLEESVPTVLNRTHPVQLMAQSYGIADSET